MECKMGLPSELEYGAVTLLLALGVHGSSSAVGGYVVGHTFSEE